MESFIVDGHNIEKLKEVLIETKKQQVPCAVIANTIKGNGVSFMTNNPGWHGKALNDDELKKALEELDV